MTTNPFTLEALVAWLETQPGETEYNYWAFSDCLLVRYIKAKGLADTGANYSRMESATHCEVAVMRPWTYSAALDRARALLPAQPDTSTTVQKIMDDALASARERV